MSAPRQRPAWLLLAVSGLFLSLAWMLASPVGAAPDEPAHIFYAWGTVTGQTIVGEHLVTIQDGRTATQTQVPQTLLQYPDSVCYRFHPETPTVQCSPIPADNQQLVTQATYMSRYPPLFYGVEGATLKVATAAGLSGPRVVYGARLAAAVLSWLVVGFGVFLLARRFPGRPVLLATLLALPATAWFLAASVNPNGLEITASFLLAAGVLAVRADDCVGRRSVSAVLAIPLGTLLLAWTRPVSWVWASLILGLLLLPTARSEEGAPWIRRLPVRRLGAVASTATVLILTSSIVWFGYALQIRASELGRESPTDWAGLGPIERVLLLLLHFGRIVSEEVGTFGWLDTPLPPAALLAWMAVAGVAVAAWFVGRSTIMPRWPVGAVLGLGCVAAMLDEYSGGWGWQGRYLLPLTAAVCVFAVPGLANGLTRLAELRSMIPWMLVVLMAVNALSVVWFLFRNVYGIRDWQRRLPLAPLPGGTTSWDPPLGLGVVPAIVTLAMACGVMGMWMLRCAPPTTGQQPLPSSPHGRSKDATAATPPGDGEAARLTAPSAGP